MHFVIQFQLFVSRLILLNIFHPS